MAVNVNAKGVYAKLAAIQSDIAYIKNHMVDLDIVLTDDDVESLKSAEKDRKLGRTIRL